MRLVTYIETEAMRDIERIKGPSIESRASDAVIIAVCHSELKQPDERRRQPVWPELPLEVDLFQQSNEARFGAERIENAVHLEHKQPLGMR